jgi:hypothetical protein
VKQDNNKFTCELQISIFVLHTYEGYLMTVTIPVTARSKALVWGRFIAGIVSSKPTERMVVRPMCLLRAV